MTAALIIERPQLSLILNRDTAAVEIVHEEAREIVIQHSGLLVVPSAGGADFIDVVPAVASGQSVFPLQAPPLSAAKVRMFVNGQRFRSPDFTVAGQIVTWASAFLLQPTDQIEFTYQTGA